MKILVYGINYAPELTGIGKYSGEMCSWLAERGHEIRVISGPPYYPEWKVESPYSAWCYRTEIVSGIKVMRCPMYVPNKLTTLKRLLHLISFALTSGLRLLTQVWWKPDITLCIVPTQFCSPMALLFAKLSGSKSVIHIQDYELDAMFGLGMAGSMSREISRLTKIAFAIESWLFRRFNKVSSISQSMLNKARKKGVSEERLFFFPNWSETARFAEVSGVEEIKRVLGVSDDNKIVLYSGNVGEKQGLENVVEAARLLRHERITFLIVGQGAGKERLVALVKELQLDNIVFRPLLPYDQLPALLAMADCHLVIQKRGVADAVLPSKLTNILAVGGQSVITAEMDTELGLLCKHNTGIAECVEPENVTALCDGIMRCLHKPKHNAIAQTYAKVNIDKDSVLGAFAEKLDSLLMS